MNLFKQIILPVVVWSALMVSCGGTKAKSNDNEGAAQSPKSEVRLAELYDYRVVAEYPHSSSSYTQGLEYKDGVMWEGTGREGRSHLQRIDLSTGKVDVVASLPIDEFGEGITHFRDRIYQLTWLSNKAHVYDSEGRHLKSVSYKGEGWGITTDGENLYLSDGTSTIRRVNPDTFATEASICVTLDGQPLDLINELEWVDGSIWANIYLTDAIVEIDPKTGEVLGYVDMPLLRERLKDNPEAEAFNGVAYNPETRHFYVTGKDWNRLFEVEIIK